MTYASCFNSSTIGEVLDYSNSYFQIKFPNGTMWVHESNINNLWTVSEDDE